MQHNIILRERINKTHDNRIKLRNRMRNFWIVLVFLSFFSVITDAIKSVYHPADDFYYAMIAIVLLTCIIGIIMPRWICVFDRPQNLLVALMRIDHEAERVVNTANNLKINSTYVRAYINANNKMLRKLEHSLHYTVSIGQDIPAPR